MEWMLMPLKRYADFSGRSRRKEYWMFVLFQIIIYVPLVILAFAVGGFGEPGSDGPPALTMIFFSLIGIVALGLLVPNLAVQVRRLHDTDKSGWLILIGIIPIINYIGSIVLFVFFCLDGTKGENQYGPDPKMSDNVGDVFN